MGILSYLLYGNGDNNVGIFLQHFSIRIIRGKRFLTLSDNALNIKSKYLKTINALCNANGNKRKIKAIAKSLECSLGKRVFIYWHDGESREFSPMVSLNNRNLTECFVDYCKKFEMESLNADSAICTNNCISQCKEAFCEWLSRRYPKYHLYIYI